MSELTIVLFERLCLLLVFAFVLTRTRGFRSLLYKEFDTKMIFVHSFVFGIFGIVGTFAGIIIGPDQIDIHRFVLSAENNQYVVSLSLVPMVIAGLFGGPHVGLGAGLIVGVHLFFIGGTGGLANAIVNPLTGMLAGWTARFFSQNRVISPFKALFIGVFPPILQMQLLLISSPDSKVTVSMVDTIGLPLVLSNSLAIAIFTGMIGLMLKEQENEAAVATKQALAIVEEALPFMKKDTEEEVADGMTNLFYERLQLAAVSVSNQKQVLAYKGKGRNHHPAEGKSETSLTGAALVTKKMQIAYSKDEIPCEDPECPLEAAIIIPVIEADEVIWLIKFYFEKSQHIRPVEITFAEGLGQLLSHQLTIIGAEKLTAHIRDAELRNLQAQINPHFLFNTLHLIASMFREDPDKARNITVQLAHYMRFNLRLVSKSLVDIKKEMTHVHAYAAIIQERFAGRMIIEFDSPSDLSEVKIPPSTIQPLVENSVQHGLADTYSGGKIMVIIKHRRNGLHVAVKDNGCGFSESMIRIVTKEPITGRSESGTGLFNVNKRLVSLLGNHSALSVKNLPGKGSEVSFYILEKDYEKEEVYS